MTWKLLHLNSFEVSDFINSKGRQIRMTSTQHMIELSFFVIQLLTPHWVLMPIYTQC